MSEATSKEVCVFLMNQVGICLPVRNETRMVTTKEIFNSVKSELLQGVHRSEAHVTWLVNDAIDGGLRLNYGHEEDWDKVFALWICSPLLELQLQPNKHPFRSLALWNSLLTKYTCASKEAIELDEPVLSFQRDVMLSKDEEKNIQNAGILELLFEEAKVNILEGRYLTNDLEELAAIAAAIDLRNNSTGTEPNAEYFKLNDHKYLPLYFRSQSTKGRSYSRKNKLGAYGHILELYKKIKPATSKDALIKQYLTICWNLDIYGSAFFTGQMEIVTKNVRQLVNHYDKEVWVAINEYGLHLVEKKSHLMLVSLHYNEFNWQLAHPADESNPNSLHCLFIQINFTCQEAELSTNGSANSCTPRHCEIRSVDDQESKTQCKMYQIFSKQAGLMTKLLLAFSSKLPDRDVADSGSFRDTINTTKPLEASTLKRLKKLTCGTFNPQGKLIKNQGSFKVI
ncbi:FERM domain-containing protein 8 [Halotydeus destructor]|nr:FERM domain-containing protein 8 [Halotydeus destructor]